MSTLVSDLGQQVKSGRESIKGSLADLQKRVDSQTMSRAGIAVGIAVFAIALGVGVAVYRRRRRRTLAARLQEALPGVVRDLPSELRGKLKRAL